MVWCDPEGRPPDPSPGEFISWLTPRWTLAKTQTMATLAPVLIQRLKSGILQAAAETACWDRLGEQYRRGITAIDPSWWVGVEGGLRFNSPVWRYGDLTIVVPDRPEGTKIAVRFFGLRFERSGIRRIVPGLEARLRAIEAPPSQPAIEEIPDAASQVDQVVGDDPNDQTRWLLAREAGELLSPLYDRPSLAREALIDLAALGAVTTWCSYYYLPRPLQNPLLRINEKHHVPVKFWDHFDRADLRETEDWALGNFCLQLEGDPGALIVKAIGVRFSEDDLRGLPEMQPVFPPEPTSTTSHEAPSAAGDPILPITPRERAPVSDAVLNAWWEFYKVVRPAHLRKDDDMQAHFDRCCPDKSVARARIRALRGPQKTGPKAGSAE
jgi:hypothetical protein